MELYELLIVRFIIINIQHFMIYARYMIHVHI